MVQKGSVWVVLLSIIAIIALVGAAYLYGQNQSLKNKSPEVIATPYVSSPPSLNQSPASSPAASKVTVIFEAEGSFTQTEKNEIRKKVIDPFLDYYAEPGNSTQNLLTLTIARNTQASKDTYPYSGKAIFDGGANMGFLIMKVGTGVDWWYPECLNGCNLSAAFKAKYPEIAAKVQ